MKVSELAAELGVPPSSVLEQCQRFGIEASWAGAELRGADEVVLRAELAADDDPLDLRPADEPAPASKLPPGVVASMPELIDEVTPEPEPADPGNDPRVLSAAGFRLAGTEIDPGAERRVPPRPVPKRRQLQVSARNSVLWLVIAVVAFLVSNLVHNPWLVAGLWLVAAVGVVATVVDAIRGHRAVTVHPDHLTGRWLSTATLVLGLVAVVAMALGLSTIVRSQPAEGAPLGAGDVASVQTLRWGYHRLVRVADSGWHRPAKDAGTCWVTLRGDRQFETVRSGEGRVETGNVRRECATLHTVEVARVFAVDRDADSPYPGAKAMQEMVRTRCADVTALVRASKGGSQASVVLSAEYPTSDGWGRGDHDVACILVGPERKGALVS